MKIKAAGDRGFTLLEVMASLAILAGVVFTVLSGLNYNLGVASGNKDLVVASVLGRELAEEAALNGIPQEKKGEFKGPYSGFSWAIENTPSEVPDIERVLINISWGRGRSVDLISYVKKK